MTKPKNGGPNRPKKQPKPGQTQGYCIPPKSGQIKTGEVRNQWGPKGKPKRVVEDPYDIAMSQMTKSNINGQSTDITVELGILLVHAQKALAGSTASFNALIKARPGRGQRFEAHNTMEDERARKVQEENARVISRKLIDLMDDYAAMKQRLGDPDDCDDPGDWPDAHS